MIADQNLPEQANSTPLTKKRPIRIKPKQIVFYTVFFMVFLFSGLLTMWGQIPYRMAFVSFLVLPLFLLYRFKITRVVIVYGLLTLAIILSGLINQSSLLEIVLFMRVILFSILIYSLVEMYVNPHNIITILRICVAIAVIQLPIVILQQLFYTSLPARITTLVSHIDFDFGTFNFKGDAPMTFFLAVIIAFLLFRDKENQVVRFKWPVLLWLTLTILITNAEIVKIIVVLIWVIYFIRYFNLKSLIYATVTLFLLFGILTGLGLLDEIWNDFTYSLSVNSPFKTTKRAAFLAGDYGRGAAVGYYLTSDVLWVGDGPSKYYDVLTSTYTRGNMGHTFTFYAEVGLFGWLFTLLIFYLIAFQKGSWRRNPRTGYIQIPWLSIAIFLALTILSFTTQVMNDISIMLIFLIIAKANAIWPELQISSMSDHKTTNG